MTYINVQFLSQLSISIFNMEIEMWTETMDNRLVFINPPIELKIDKIMKQIQKLHGLLHSATRAIYAWHRKRADLQHLQELDDRLLADIGLSRLDLH